jgi:hypothetical protein
VIPARLAQLPGNVVSLWSALARAMAAGQRGAGLVRPT